MYRVGHFGSTSVLGAVYDEQAGGRSATNMAMRRRYVLMTAVSGTLHTLPPAFPQLRDLSISQVEVLTGPEGWGSTPFSSIQYQANVLLDLVLAACMGPSLHSDPPPPKKKETTSQQIPNAAVIHFLSALRAQEPRGWLPPIAALLPPHS